VNGMILGAGYGTRLGARTADIPKALVSVGDRSMLSIAGEKLRRAGVETVVVNAHHFAEQVERAAGDSLTVIREERILGTGGGIRNAAPILGEEEPVLVHNVDVLSTVSLRRMFAAYQERPCTALLAVQERDSSRPVAVDEAGFVCGRFGGEPVRSPIGKTRSVGFCGIQILGEGVAARLEGEGAFSVFDSLQDLAVRGEEIRAFPIGRDYWIDLGTLEDLARAESDLTDGRITMEKLLG